jgi:hypothetical protein
LFVRYKNLFVVEYVRSKSICGPVRAVKNLFVARIYLTNCLLTLLTNICTQATQPTHELTLLHQPTQPPQLTLSLSLYIMHIYNIHIHRRAMRHQFYLTLWQHAGRRLQVQQVSIFTAFAVLWLFDTCASASAR